MFWRQVSGFSLALMSMVLYSLYMVPRKQSKISQKAYTFWMAVGLLIGSTVISIAIGGGLPKVTAHQYLIIALSGAVWGTGTLAYCSAVTYIGLSRSTPIKNTSAVLGALVGILCFHEFPFSHVAALTAALLGSVCVFAAATILGRVESVDDAQCKPGSNHMLYGILTAAWASIAYSLYTIPMKITYAQGVTPAAFLFYMAHGIFVSMTLLAIFIKSPKDAPPVTAKDRWLAQGSGLMWAIGSLCANISVKLIGVAVTWPMTKNPVVAVLYGVLVLKEIDRVKHRRDLRTGLALSIVGIILLALALA